MKNIFSFSVAPKRQFKLLLVVSFFVLLLFTLVEGYIFYMISHKQGIQSTDGNPQVSETVREQTLSGVLARYTQKDSFRAQVLTKIPMISEPSR